MHTAGGRPPTVDKPEVMRRILTALAQGVPVSIACNTNGISPSLVRQWAEQDAVFAAAKDDAMRVGFDQLAHECLQIIDDGSNDWMEERDRNGLPTGGWRLNTEAILRSKARVETRLRLLAVWDRAGYGPQQQVKVDASVEVTEVKRHVIDPRSLDDAGRAGLRALLAQAEAAGLLPPPDEDEATVASYTVVGQAQTSEREGDG